MELPIEFTSNLLATLFGALIGIVGGLWLDKRKDASKQKEEAKTILQAVFSELTRNATLLKQMYDELPGNVIFYNLDLSAWQATSSEQLGTIKNYELVKRISGMYYEFQHLSRKVDIQFEMHYSSCRAFTGYNQLRKEIVDPIVKHAAQLQVQLTTLIPDIKLEIEKL
jgi:hypothetical protein